MFKRSARVLLVSLALPALAAAQMPAKAPGAPIAKRVTAGTYTIEPSHAQVLFTVNHLGFTEYSGQFTNPTGTLVLDPNDPSKDKVDVTFAIDKVQTTVPALDAHLKSPDFFDAAKFPEARFVSTAVAVKGMTARISGNLTIKGVTRPVVLDARFIGAGPAPMGPPKLNIGFAARATIKRSDFGVGYGIPMVSDKVDLVINAGFVAQ